MSGSAPRVPSPPAPLRYHERIDLLSGAVSGWDASGCRLGLAEVCAVASRWTVARLSIPVSARTLQADGIAEALERSGLALGGLELRLPPSAMKTAGTRTLLALSALRDLGVGLALDASCVSLALLQRLPLTSLILDPALTQTLPNSAADEELAGAMIHAGHALGLHVVARGIETEAQRACLLRLGCDAGLGCLFGPPRDTPNHCLTCEPAHSAPALTDDHSFAWRLRDHRGHHTGANGRAGT